MLVIGLILSIFGIGLFCWLIFTLAVYALPVFVGLTAGMAAFHSGAGILGAFLVGIIVGALTLGLGQVAFALVKPIPLRAGIAAAFAVPAAIAGYHLVLGLSEIGVPSPTWQQCFAWIGAIVIGCSAWARMTVLAEPLPLRPGGVTADEPQPVFHGRNTRRLTVPSHRPALRGTADCGRELTSGRADGHSKRKRIVRAALPAPCVHKREPLRRAVLVAHDPTFLYATASFSTPIAADILRSTTAISHAFS